MKPTLPLTLSVTALAVAAVSAPAYAQDPAAPLQRCYDYAEQFDNAFAGTAFGGRGKAFCDFLTSDPGEGELPGGGELPEPPGDGGGEPPAPPDSGGGLEQCYGYAEQFDAGFAGTPFGGGGKAFCDLMTSDPGSAPEPDPDVILNLLSTDGDGDDGGGDYEGGGPQEQPSEPQQTQYQPSSPPAARRAEQAPRAEIEATRLTAARGGTVRVPVACPRTSNGRCTGVATLEVRVPVRKKARKKGARKAQKTKRVRQKTKRVRISRARVSIPAGEKAALRMRLSKTGQRLLRRRGRLVARVTVTTTTAAGRKRTVRRTVTIVKATSKKKQKTRR